MVFLKKTLKAATLFTAILLVVTCVAAIVGCLFLSNGQLAYLVQPTELIEFVWVTRAGLKVTVFFVAVMIFLMCAEDGALGRPWGWPPVRMPNFNLTFRNYQLKLTLRRKSAGTNWASAGS